ncbi:MAG: AAA family ATPase [Myxococcota bacterium]
MQENSLAAISVNSLRARDRLARILRGSPRREVSSPSATDTEPQPLLRRLAELTTLLREEHLVTLTGPAGAGKSTLARALREVVRDEFEAGICYVDVSGVGTMREFLELVGHAVEAGPVPPSTADAIVTLETTFGRRGRTLLLIDGCDDIALLAGDCLERWVGGADTLTVLVTCREPLGVYGERECHLDATARPDAARRGAA